MNRGKFRIKKVTVCDKLRRLNRSIVDLILVILKKVYIFHHSNRIIKSVSGYLLLAAG